MIFLFLCVATLLWSPSGAQVFGDRPVFVALSAGFGKYATVPLTRELLEWADLVFVMEKRQRNIIHSRFDEIYKHKRIICLYIPDEFELMDPELIELLEAKVTPYLETYSVTKQDE
jgi:predicted protein tyrosine phosphatase